MTLLSTSIALLTALVDDPAEADAVPAIAAWLLSHEQVTEQGSWWTAAPAAEERAPAVSLYSGSPGVVLFLDRFAREHGDAAAAAAAARGAEFLAHQVERTGAQMPCGLYTGLAGLGFTFLELARGGRGPVWRGPADRCVDLLLERRIVEPTPHGPGAHWNDETDVISGTAGIALFLLRSAAILDRSDARDAAIEAGHRLLTRADRQPAGLRWPMNDSFPRWMPGFSHGTAGVAYTLATLFIVTREGVFLDAAIEGARSLRSLMHEKGAAGLIGHHSPGGEELYYLGWCHGPIGTGRLFYRLWQITGDAAHLEPLDAGLDALIESGIPTARPDGFWNNVSQCCGSAGVAEYLGEMANRRARQDADALRRTLTADLLARGEHEGGVLSFPQAEHRVRPELIQAQTGYMQGAAGIGIGLLRQQARAAGRVDPLPFPDSPFGPLP
jgi:lantibiotic modifying enzyme